MSQKKKKSDDNEWKKLMVSKYKIFDYIQNLLQMKDDRVKQATVIALSNLTTIEVMNRCVKL